MTDAIQSKILIAYPADFLCYEKFNRKVARILSNIDNISLIALDDPNNFISRFSSENNITLSPTEGTKELDAAKVTHGIIFREKDLFQELIDTLASYGAKTRIIGITITRVVNVDKGNKSDVYIGRGSPWGNPYAIGFSGDRDEVIRKFRYDFDRDFLRFTKQETLSLKGKTLGCHCKPAACHGDVIAEYLNSYDDGE